MQWAGTGWLEAEAEADPTPVKLRIDGGWLAIIDGEKEATWWPLRELRIERRGDAWRATRAVPGLTFPALIVEDAEFPQQVKDAAKAVAREHAGAGATAWAALAGFAALCAGVVYFAWNVALPWTGMALASTVPTEWEERLGRETALAIAPEQTRCRNPGVEAALHGLTKRLRGALQRGKQYSYNVVIADRPGINAVAAPGGSIVLFRGLIESVDDPGQLAAVLAHEMQHVALRHSTQAVFRGLSLRVILGFLFGDFTSVAATIVGDLGQLKYARGDEEEADREGMRLLARAGLESGAMPAMLHRLQAASGSESAGPTWLSSHSSPSERINALEKVALPRADASGPALTEMEFRVLIDACPE